MTTTAAKRPEDDLKRVLQKNPPPLVFKRRKSIGKKFPSFGQNLEKHKSVSFH